ncbi:MAG: tetratricopeptide repeat protein [Cyanobacteria bacterium P01_H01_bin.58]
MCPRLLLALLTSPLVRQSHVSDLCLQTFILRQSVGYASFMGKSFWALGSLYRQHRELDQAIKFWQAAVQSFTQSQDFIYLGVSLRQLGELYMEQRQYSRSQACSQAAVAVLEPCNVHHEHGHAVYQLGLACLKSGQLSRAEAELERAMQLYQMQQNDLGENRALISLGKLYARRHEFMFALACYESALDSLLASYQSCERTEYLLIEVLCEISILCRETGHFDWANVPYQDVLSHFIARSRRAELAQACRELGRMYEEDQQYRLALECYYRALQSMPLPLSI